MWFVGCLMRMNALQSKDDAVEILQTRRRRIDPMDDNREQKGLALALEDVNRIDARNFCKITRHPLFRAVLIPFGGLGTLQVLMMLT